MKISDILKENSDVNYDKVVEYSKQIINSEFFKNNKDTILSGTVLYHGSNAITEPASILNIEDRKQPQDTSPVIHDITNKLTNEKYGVNVRDKFFTITREASAMAYGNPFMVFPISDYDLYYNLDIDDFYVESRRKINIGFEKVIEKFISKGMDIILNNIDVDTIFNEIKKLSEYPLDKEKDINKLKNIISNFIDKKALSKKIEQYIGVATISAHWFIGNNVTEGYVDIGYIIDSTFTFFESFILDNIVTEFMHNMDDPEREQFIGTDDIEKINQNIENMVEDKFNKNAEYFDKIIYNHFSTIINELYLDDLEKSKRIPDSQVEVLLNSKKAILIHSQYKNLLIQLLREGSQ